MSQTLLIADLHLSEHTPSLNELFSRQLNQWQGNIDALYILGDFFDAWVGDDDDSSFIRQIKAQLHTFTRHTPIYFIHGNRDFLLGNTFAQQTGISLLDEVVPVSLYGRHYVLVHGDELCTDDIAYQQFRQQTRQRAWQQMILSKPLAERRMLAGQIRQMSEQRKTDEGKSEVSDATEAGIQALMQRFDDTPAPTLIHGHTHRPAIHIHRRNGQIFERHVLQDWYNLSGGAMVIDDQKGISHIPLTAKP